MTFARDDAAHHFPVSVKGVVVRDGAVVLLKNARDEWELPGGKLEPAETPEECVAREIGEELGLAVSPSLLVDAWVYAVTPNIDVLIVTYGCVERDMAPAMLSDEHRALAWVPLAEVDALRMPEGYKRSIRRWTTRAAGHEW